MQNTNKQTDTDSLVAGVKLGRTEQSIVRDAAIKCYQLNDPVQIEVAISDAVQLISRKEAVAVEVTEIELLEQTRDALNRLLNLAKHPLSELADVSPVDDVITEAENALSRIKYALQ